MAGGTKARESRQLGLSNGGSSNANNYNRPAGVPASSGQKQSISSTATKQQAYGSAQKKGGFAGSGSFNHNMQMNGHKDGV